MTAVIAILNKLGVAIAADSAATVGDSFQQKIYNNANKIFALSKFHPVGVMIYNVDSFMEIPWEILIKQYRKQLADRHFPKLEEYQKDFFRYLKEEIIPQINVNTERAYLENLFEEVLEFFIQRSVKNTDELENMDKVDVKTRQALIVSKIEVLIQKFHGRITQHIEKLPEFANYTYESFKASQLNLINEVYNRYFSELPISDSSRNLLYEFLYHLVASPVFDWGKWTGLVFTGYGENEMYPSCISVKCAEVIEGKIRYDIDEDGVKHIHNEQRALVLPFAQRDVIELLLSGIDTKLERIYINTFRSTMEKYIKSVIAVVSNRDEELADQLKDSSSMILNNAIKELVTEIEKAKDENHNDPTLDAVSLLSKEDLIEMAESLIYLTYLKRRISFKEESVGGPVDVAFISKGDGFIWIKRKHYFKPELNYHFFQNYLKIDQSYGSKDKLL